MKELIERYKSVCKDFSLVKNIRPAIRINTLKISEKELVSRLKKKKVKLKKIPWLKTGYWYESRFPIATMLEHLLGYFYIQSAAAQIVSEILNPIDKDIVLDCCSAPGGKATHIAMLMKNKGRIIALDLNDDRMIPLRNNIERLGVANIIAIKKDARDASDLNISFDKILVDAPCSGNYLSNSDWFSKREIKYFKRNADKQKAILNEMYKVLKKGGVLVYSTCSLEPEENEEVINWFITKYPDMKLLNIDVKAGGEGLTSFQGKEYSRELRKTLRFWPHKTGTEGFFIAKMRKN